MKRRNIMIKRILFFIMLLTATMVSCSYTIFAQSPYFSIFDSFEQPSRRGKGAVVIHISDSIKKLVGTRIDSENTEVINGKTFYITRGYRIKVYSGNNQRTSNKEASDMEKKIKTLYPNTRTNKGFNAPFWELYMGDFTSIEEASYTLRELHKAMPQIKNEIYIIEADIKLPLDEP